MTLSRFAVSFSVLCSIGCASEAPPHTPPPVTTPAPVPVDPGMAPAGPTGGLAGLKSSGKLRVAADPDAAPFLAKKDGAWEGFEYILAKSVADQGGLQLEIVAGSFSELEDLVVTGKADIAIGQLSPSASYTGLDWSVSYLQYSLCLIVPKGSAVKGMADLKAKKVGLYDDPVARQLTNVLVGASFDAVVFEDYGYFEQMARGQLDAMIYDCPLARHEMKLYGDALVVADSALNVTTYNAAVRKGDAVMLADVNGVLKGLGESGLLATLEEKWLGSPVQAGDFTTATGKVVVVKKGDTLGVIAGRELGSADAWQKLYDANKDVVGPNPDVIYAGMKLRVPKA